MVVRDHPALSLSRQCRLLSLGRSSLYYEPKGESAETLVLMRRIDELFLKYPFYGARRMALHLRREGVRIGRRRAARLMRLMGLQAIYRAPRTSAPHPGGRSVGQTPSRYSYPDNAHHSHDDLGRRAAFHTLPHHPAKELSYWTRAQKNLPIAELNWGKSR